VKSQFTSLLVAISKLVSWQNNQTQVDQMDCIHITDIRCYGYTGFLAEEQILGQWFEVDLALWLDLSKAGKSDAIEDTLDYRNAIAKVKQLVKTAKFALVERLAEAIATSLLEFDRVIQVQVKLTKPAAPIPDFGGKITVELTRSKLQPDD
jgi:7,8-dihydroneopterin aldolase/epimerase/oxygenase